MTALSTVLVNGGISFIALVRAAMRRCLVEAVVHRAASPSV